MGGGGRDEEITGEVVVLATPYDGALDYAEKHGEQLASKVVVDINNSVD